MGSILVIEYNEVKKTFTLPLFANGKPTLLFQTTKGTIKGSSNYLTLFGQTVLPEQLILLGTSLSGSVATLLCRGY